MKWLALLFVPLATLAQSPPAKPSALALSIADRERKVAADPEDLATRAGLLQTYWSVRPGGDALMEDVRKARREHVLWFIAHHPETYVLANPESRIEPQEGSLADAQGFLDAAKLWKEAVAKPDARVETIAHAAYFFGVSERLTAFAILEPVWLTYPHDPLVARVRGTLDALEILGATAAPGPNELKCDEVLAQSPQALNARKELGSTDNIGVAGAAGQFLVFHQMNALSRAEINLNASSLAELLLKRAIGVEPSSAVWVSGLVSLYQFRALREPNPTERVRLYREALHFTTFDNQRLFLLGNLAEAELDAGESEAAGRDAARILEIPVSHNAQSGYWDAVHKAQTIMGRASLKRGDTAQARLRLLASAQVETTPSLGSVGPGMTLAQELLEAGEKQTVIEYLETCRRIWTNNQGKLDGLLKAVRSESSPNLLPPAERGPSFALGSKPPPFKLKDLAGKEWALADLTGKVVALDFWATWCGPCRDEMPALSKVAREMSDRDAVVLGIDANEDAEMVRKWVAENPLGFPALLGDDATIRSYQVHAYPTLVVLDRQGAVAYIRVGQLSESEFRQAMEKGFAGAPVLKKLAIPEPVSPPPGAVFDRFPRETTVTWKPVAGAASYVAEWDYRQPDGWWSELNRGTLPRIAASGISATFKFVGAQPGRWRVYAVGPNGERSEASAWREFRYTR
jgi:thiol-disulfide isomerase/thioredoxin